jgi:hypothetical protein
MPTVLMGQMFVDQDNANCPQCTWFVETNLPADGMADWGTLGVNTMSVTRKTVGTAANALVFGLIAQNGVATRFLRGRQRGGNKKHGCVRLEFLTITENTNVNVTISSTTEPADHGGPNARVHTVR